MLKTLFWSVVATALMVNTSESQTDPRLVQGPKPEAVGDKAMVATQLPIVSEAALEVLKEGGNAVDAMVTAVFLQHVNDFHQVSHFGAMSAIGYDADSGEYYAINAVSERPQADRGEHGDPSKVAIGGVVRGLEALANKFGSRPWASYVQPAIKSAEEGVVVTSFMYGIKILLTRNPGQSRTTIGVFRILLASATIVATVSSSVRSPRSAFPTHPFRRLLHDERAGQCLGILDRRRRHLHRLHRPRSG